MATFHSGSEGQTQKLQALRRRQKYLAFRAVIVPPVCWGICAASAPWWFPPLKETLGVRFDAQTQGWILLVLMLLMISLPVLISLHLKRRAARSTRRRSFPPASAEKRTPARCLADCRGASTCIRTASSTRGIAANAIWWRCAAAGQRSSR